MRILFLTTLFYFLSLLVLDFSQAKSCVEIFKGDESEIQRSWQLYTLTDPNLELSQLAEKKLAHFYMQKWHHQILRLVNSGEIKRKDLISWQRLGQQKIHNFLETKRKQIYRRFEESKAFRASQPDVYRATLEAIGNDFKKSKIAIENKMRDYFGYLPRF